MICSHQLLLRIRSKAASNTHLPCHYDLGSSVLHLADSSSIARTELTQNYQVFGLEVQLELDAYLQCVGPPLFVS
jgi:hypothetical protein